MTQTYDIDQLNFDTDSPPVGFTRTRNSIESLLSHNRGTSRPSYLVAGGVWVKEDYAANTEALYFYDGSDDILIGTLDIRQNEFIPAQLAAAAQSQRFTAVTTAGADDYTATPLPALSSYNAGLRLRVKFAEANTKAACTLNLSGLGAKELKKQSDQGLSDLSAGDISANALLDIEYDGFNMVITNLINTPKTKSFRLRLLTSGTSYTPDDLSFIQI